MASPGGVAADTRPSIDQSAAATLRSARRALGAALLALIRAILAAAAEADTHNHIHGSIPPAWPSQRGDGAGTVARTRAGPV